MSVGGGLGEWAACADASRTPARTPRRACHHDGRVRPPLRWRWRGQRWGRAPGVARVGVRRGARVADAAHEPRRRRCGVVKRVR